MKKSFWCSLLALLFLCKGGFADDIEGFWQILNQRTGLPRCIVAIYGYEDKFYGRIIATYDASGIMNDTIYNPIQRAPGVMGNPFYAGLDLLWNLRGRGVRYKGKIIDPEKGNIYNAEVWRDGDNLVARGELLVFGKNQTWVPVPESEFTANFKKPDTKEFVPVVPRVR